MPYDEDIRCDTITVYSFFKLHFLYMLNELARINKLITTHQCQDILRYDEERVKLDITSHAFGHHIAYDRVHTSRGAHGVLGIHLAACSI